MGKSIVYKGGNVFGSRYKKGLNKKEVKQVQKIINKNLLLKQIYLFINNQSPTNVGILTELTAFDTGTQFNQRDSNRIRLMSYNVKLQFTFPPNDNSLITIRMLIVRSKQGQLSLADLPDFNQQPDLDLMQVYFDKQYAMSPTVVDGTTPTTSYSLSSNSIINDIQDFKSFKTKKVPHLNVGYNDDSTDSPAVTNPIYIYFVTGFSVPTINVNGWAHMKFYDKD